jgi:NNP family nitrate/nitrite transporter-like MFS transporter
MPSQAQENSDQHHITQRYEMDNSSMLRDAGPHQVNASNTFLKHLGPLLLLTLIFFLNFIARITLAPLVPNIEADLTLTHAAAGSLFFLISLGYFITLTGSGFISSRLNHKRTIVLSNTALGLVLIATAFCKGLWTIRWTIRLGLFLLGMTAGLYLPSGIAMLTALVSSRHWGKAIAIHELAPNVSFVAAPLISEAILLQFSWRIVFIFLGLAALTMSPLFARFSRGGQFLGEALSSLSVRKLFTNLSFWAMVLLFSLGVSSTLGIYTMLPLYLVSDHGMDLSVGGQRIVSDPSRRSESFYCLRVF